MPRPGQERVASRPLHFFWIVDCSGSMGVDGKIESLNNAIKDALPAMRKVADDNPNIEMFVRTVVFSNGAQWHDSEPTPVHEFEWHDVTASGVTDLGAAFRLVAEELAVERLGSRGYPPVLVLISDGQPTDDYRSPLAELMAQQWGKRAVRLAIAIGQDADHGPLEEFINNVEFPVLQANTPDALVDYIKWVSSEVSRSVSAPSSKAVSEKETTSNVELPPPPDVTGASGDDVW